MKPYYQDSAVTIYHGDCREMVPSLEFNVIVTDPPYGVSHASNYGASWNGTEIEGDGDTSLRDELLKWWTGPAVVFGSWKRPRPEGTRAVLIWDKGPASGMGDLSFPWKCSHEEVYIIGEGFTGRRDEGVLRFNVVTWETQGRAHPNAKPVELLTHLVGKCPPGTILDPFMGSGTTLRAAKDLGRKAIGIEIEERYCEIAARRCSQEVMELR